MKNFDDYTKNGRVKTDKEQIYSFSYLIFRQRVAIVNSCVAKN